MAKAASTTSEFEPEVVQEIPPYQSALGIGSIYTPRPVKRRRATKAEVVARRNALREIVSAMQPMTVRQVFYQATVQALVDKSEVGYRKVQNDLVLMRRTSLMPYEWLTDNTRWQRRPKPRHDSVLTRHFAKRSRQKKRVSKKS